MFSINDIEIKHDATGNQLNDQQGREYHYNHNGHLSSVTEQGSLVAEYHYEKRYTIHLLTVEIVITLKLKNMMIKIIRTQINSVEDDKAASLFCGQIIKSISFPLSNLFPVVWKLKVIFLDNREVEIVAIATRTSNVSEKFSLNINVDESSSKQCPSSTEYKHIDLQNFHIEKIQYLFHQESEFNCEVGLSLFDFDGNELMIVASDEEPCSMLIKLPFESKEILNDHIEFEKVRYI